MCTPLGKNIVGSFFWSYPLLSSAFRLLPFLSRGFTHAQERDIALGNRATSEAVSKIDIKTYYIRAYLVVAIVSFSYPPNAHFRSIVLIWFS